MLKLVSGKQAATAIPDNLANGRKSKGKNTTVSVKSHASTNGAVVARVPGGPPLISQTLAVLPVSRSGANAIKFGSRVGDAPYKAFVKTKPLMKIADGSAPAAVVAPPVPIPPTSEKRIKNKAGFSDRDLELFRDLLLERRREILGDMHSMEREALRESSSDLSNLPVHMADQGTDAYEQEFTLGLVEKDRTQLRDINASLAKIQNGTYGICEGTGLPISRPRLEACPWARYSIEHARAMEKKQGIFRR